jgi:hypothetical protein
MRLRPTGLILLGAAVAALVLGSSPSPARAQAPAFTLIATEPGFAGPSFWTPRFSLPSLNAAGTVAYSTYDMNAGLQGVYTTTMAGTTRTIETGISTFGRPIINNFGNVLYSRGDTLRQATATMILDIASPRDPTFPAGQTLLAYDSPRSSNIPTGAVFSTSAGPDLAGLTNWTVKWSGPNPIVSSATGSPSGAVGSPSAGDFLTVAYRVPNGAAGELYVSKPVVGPQQISLGAGVTRIGDPMVQTAGQITRTDQVVLAVTRFGQEEIVTVDLASGVGTTRLDGVAGRYANLGQQFYPDRHSFGFFPTQLGTTAGAVALNDVGRIVFTAERLTAIDTRPGLFTVDTTVRGAAITKIVERGDGLFGSTVVDVAFANDGLNDVGQVSFLARLADGRNVIARADLPGATPANPMLPTSLLPGGGFAFNNVPGGLWYDPPLVDGFDFAMTGGSLFTGILDFPPGFADPFAVYVGGVLLGTFGPGQSVSFGAGVSAFTVAGIRPLVDAANPLAFPIRLAFNTPTASFTMIPRADPAVIPEPGTLALLLVGAGGLALGRRRRRAS